MIWMRKLLIPQVMDKTMQIRSELPVMNAHGVGFRFPNEPSLIDDFSALIGAAHVSVDRMTPIVGHT